MASELIPDPQRQQLLEAAPAIARAVAAAGGSGARTETELDAFIGLVDRTAHETSGDTLLGDLVGRLHSALSAGTVGPVGEDVISDGIHAARQAGAILAVLPDEAGAREVRLWLLQVANTVAAAAREGGLFGIGSEDVSRPERDTVGAIADALGVTGEPDA